MQRERLEWVALILLTALVGGGWIYLSRDAEAARQPVTLEEAPYVGHTAPDFTLTTLQGETIALADLRGRPVVLNFWATWCPPCRIEMPYFQRAGEKYADRVAILGVNQAETADIVADFAYKNNLTYPLLLDEDLTVNHRYAVLNLPTTIFIDAEGVVREVIVGTINQGVLEDRIEKLLDS